MIYLFLGFNILIAMLVFAVIMVAGGENSFYVAFGGAIAMFIVSMIITGKIYEKRKNKFKKDSDSNGICGMLECGGDILDCDCLDGCDGLDICDSIDICS